MFVYHEHNAANNEDRDSLVRSEGEKIPWNDPESSDRMLEYHLTQEHDLASRRFDIIDRHVDWIHNKLIRFLKVD